MELKKMTLIDIPFVNNIRNIYAKEFLHDSRTFTVSESINWFNTTNPEFWIIYNDLGEKIGYFRTSNFSKINKNILIGADIAPEYTGKGYAKKSYRLFMDFLFKNYDLHKISLKVLSSNTRAISLYEKLGFVKEGVERDEVLKDDKWVDSITMSILKYEFYQKLSFCVSLYFGKREYDYNNIKVDPLFLVKKHIEILNKIDFHKVYFICTFDNSENKTKIFNDIKSLYDKDNLVLEYKENKGGSYSSWKYGLDIDKKDSDYMILIEDDYVLDNENSCRWLLEYFKSNKDLFYLCQFWFDKNYNGEKKLRMTKSHAAISNGMIDVKKYYELKESKNIDFNVVDIGINKDNKSIMIKNQLNFLDHFVDNGYVIQDIREKYSSLFNDCNREIIDFGNKSGINIFLPITN